MDSPCTGTKHLSGRLFPRVQEMYRLFGEGGGGERERCTVCRIIGFEIVGGINIVGSAKNNWKNVQVFRCWTQGSGKGEGVDRIVEMK